MTRRLVSLLALAAFAVLVITIPARAEDRPLQKLPYTPSLDVTALDKSVDPCVDFYQYSCGGWEKNNPLPGDQSNWSVYGKVYNDNQSFLWGLLEEAAKPSPARGAAAQKTGDHFAACMDQDAIDAKGLAPIQADLDAIQALSNKAALAALLGQLDISLGNGILFAFGSNQDLGDSSRVIAFAGSGGQSLPDRDYYLKDDEKSKEIRSQFTAHIVKLLTLAGDTPEVAATRAATALRFETELARASLPRVERRDPEKIFHVMPFAKLQEMTPDFSWTAYGTAAGFKAEGDVNVTEPQFYARVSALLANESLDDWKTFLRWRFLNQKARYLTRELTAADFAFYRKALRGVASPTPRWKLCVAWVDRDLPEALGQVFVERAFPPEAKQRTKEMAEGIVAAMKKRLEALPWMSAETKKMALAKLSTLRNKIGYPDRWRDYSGLEIKAGDLVGNIARAQSFENRRQLAKIGKPVDRDEWQMSPPTVNAYYDPAMNDMNFPAGVLLPPLFDPKMDDAPNYGNTGSTIGHELTHGFDDSGSKFDALGNLRDWWTEADGKEFAKRTRCVVDQYSGYTIVDDIKINGELTLGEDVADLGGTILAYEAWRAATANQKLAPIDGLNPDQRFFIGFAQWVCNVETDENKRVRAKVDPHSPGKNRINGVVVNMPEFAAAFACKPGQPMVRPEEAICRIW